MAKFRFVARDRSGAAVRGQRDAVSAGMLLAELRGEGLLPLSVDAAGGVPLASRRWRWFGPSAQDVEIELRQLGFMIRSGVTLLQALTLSTAQDPHRRVAVEMQDVAHSIQEGASLAEALRRHRCFDALTCSLVEVGEEGGHLDTVLERAADLLERKRQLRTQLITALIYPALVLAMAAATVAYMLVGVIPKLTTFLSSLGRHLPPTTLLLVRISTFVRTWFVDAMLGLAVLGVLLAAAARTRAGRAAIDAVIVRLPIVGKIVSLAAVSAFAHNLALLVRSGVRITAGLAVVEAILPLPRFTRRVARARHGVVQGLGLSEALARTRAFHPLVTGMIAIGETSGRLDEVLEHVAEFHDGRLRDLVRRLGAIVEPVILVVIGCVVGFVYLSFFSAVYSFAGKR